MLMELPPSINVLGEPVVSHLGLDHQGDSAWVLDSWRVVLAAPSDWLLRPVEELGDVHLGHRVDGDGAGDDLLLALRVESCEGVERAGHAAEFSAVWRVVVGVLPRSPCLLDLLERVAVGGRVHGGLPFPSVKCTRLVKEGRGVEPWFRLVVSAIAALPPVAAEALRLALRVPSICDEVDSPVTAALAGEASVDVTEIGSSSVVAAARAALSSRLIVGFLVLVFLRVPFGDLQEVWFVVECAVHSFELGDLGLVAARGLEAVDRGVWVDADRVVP